MSCRRKYLTSQMFTVIERQICNHVFIFQHLIAVTAVVVPCLFLTPDMSKKQHRSCGAKVCCVACGYLLLDLPTACCKPLWKWLGKVNSHKHEWVYHSKPTTHSCWGKCWREAFTFLSSCSSDHGIRLGLNCCRNLNWLKWDLFWRMIFMENGLKSPFN